MLQDEYRNQNWWAWRNMTPKGMRTPANPLPSRRAREGLLQRCYRGSVTAGIATAHAREPFH